MSANADPLDMRQLRAGGRSHVSPARLLAGAGAGPVAWFVQLAADYGLASHRCFPTQFVRILHLPGWQDIWWELLLINLAAIVVSLVAAALSYANWRRARPHAKAAGHVIEAGEGRAAFIALWGTMTGLGFFVATIFDTIVLLGMPTCAS